MRKSVMLFVLVFAYIWGCSGSEDKYDLIPKEDRKSLAQVCKCMEPVTVYKEKMATETDTSLRRMYRDSFEVKAAEMLPCLEEFEKLEVKFGTSEKYLSQMVEYIKEKHPNCVPLMLGIGPTDSVNFKK